MAKSLNEQMLDIAAAYLAQGGTKPYDLGDLAAFAINGGHYQGQAKALLQQCKRDFARAFREQYHTDPQGRDVRTYHAAERQDDGSVQKVFWADMRDAEPGHMELAFLQRRNQIVGDCVQLKKDADSYNDNNKDGASIQLTFDFTDDIAEREQPGDKYRPDQPR
ncbi:MAG: hypothetical protein HQ582_33545 [Planctomycetes bacterium]|nr:hypothetical protein [Planctomycetota bacterium]